MPVFVADQDFHAFFEVRSARDRSLGADFKMLGIDKPHQKGAWRGKLAHLRQPLNNTAGERGADLGPPDIPLGPFQGRLALDDVLFDHDALRDGLF